MSGAWTAVVVLCEGARLSWKATRTPHRPDPSNLRAEYLQGHDLDECTVHIRSGFATAEAAEDHCARWPAHPDERGMLPQSLRTAPPVPERVHRMTQAGAARMLVDVLEGELTLEEARRLVTAEQRTELVEGYFEELRAEVDAACADAHVRAADWSAQAWGCDPLAEDDEVRCG